MVLTVGFTPGNAMFDVRIEKMSSWIISWQENGGGRRGARWSTHPITEIIGFGSNSLSFEPSQLFSALLLIGEGGDLWKRKEGEI